MPNGTVVLCRQRIERFGFLGGEARSADTTRDHDAQRAHNPAIDDARAPMVARPRQTLLAARPLGVAIA